MVSLSDAEKIAKSVGANRVSDSFKKKMKQILEDYGKELSKKSIKFASYKGRMTIRSEDLENALR
jgi:histone H3/H4